MSPAERAILRSLCFHEAWEYAPTRVELLALLDVGVDLSLMRDEASHSIEELISRGIIKEIDGRVGLPDSIDAIVRSIRERDTLQPRKRRRAQTVARWLARCSGVRFVALANTTALGNARDDGDLDFFVITRHGTIWSTRLAGGAPFRLLRWTPAPGRERDAVCLSYFIADDGLDLSPQMLRPDDPYFRYWFLSLLPLVDDGVSQDLWNANAALRARHLFAERWIPPPDLAVSIPVLRIPARVFESLSRWFQMRWFPSSIRERMNRDTTVMVTDQALKFHTTDNRDRYRQIYQALCLKHGIDP